MKEKEIKSPFSLEQNEDEVFEIYPGMTAEEMKALFFDSTALIEPGYKLFQLNSNGQRYYYLFDDTGTPKFYPSVTTILSQTLPKSPFLINWIAEKGIEEAERYRDERAAYGTFMHAAFEELLINRVYDLDGLKDKLKAYIENKSLPNDFIYYADQLKKDVLAFAQFITDYDVKPLAVEIALAHPIGYAGMIDLVCTMLVRPGSNERINAIVDFKSGRKGFYEEAEIQAHFYKKMWEENYPDTSIERVYNFSPKDWRKNPTYNLKNQTDSPNALKIPALLELASIENEKKDNVFTVVSGVIDLDSDSNLNENITSLTLSDLVKSKKSDKKEIAPEKNISNIDDEEKENKPNKRTKKPSTAVESKKGAIIRKKEEKAAESKKIEKAPQKQLSNQVSKEPIKPEQKQFVESAQNIIHQIQKPQETTGIQKQFNDLNGQKIREILVRHANNSYAQKAKLPEEVKKQESKKRENKQVIKKLLNDNLEI